jgi:hypothetical protein
MTEVDAAYSYACAWNRLDPTEFLDVLSEDVKYASQWVFEELKGKEEFSAYFAAKMQTIKGNAADNPQAKVFAELATTSKSYPGRSCVVMAQGDEENVQSVVLFEIGDNLIKRLDMCMPEILAPIRSGVDPI